MEIKKVVVVGMGLMGSGIAQSYAEGGCEVYVTDIAEDMVKKGMGSIDKYLSKAVSKGKLEQAKKDEIFGRIKPVKSIEDATDVDLAQEAAPENMELKKKIHSQMDEVLPSHVIQAVCTSALCISEIASATKRPEKIIGTHFHSPAQIMKLVEVIRGLNTSDDTADSMTGLLERCRKLPIVVIDSPGFITSRIWCPFGMAAIQTLVEGVGTAESIDAAIKAGFNHPMGPLELMDIIGLDIMLHAAEDLSSNYGPAYAPPTRLRVMVAGGLLGVKTGQGFYKYPRK